MISLRCKNEALDISERYHGQSLFLFLSSSGRGIEDTFEKFVNAVLVCIYNCLCAYRYFSRYSLKTKNATFFSSIAFWDFSVNRSFYLSITTWHFQLSGRFFQMTGCHDLIGSSRSVEIFAAALGSSTSGSKSYFNFRLYDSISSESSRQQQIDDPTHFMYIGHVVGVVNSLLWLLVWSLNAKFEPDRDTADESAKLCTQFPWDMRSERVPKKKPSCFRI